MATSTPLPAGRDGSVAFPAGRDGSVAFPAGRDGAAAPGGSGGGGAVAGGSGGGGAAAGGGGGATTRLTSPVLIGREAELGVLLDAAGLARAGRGRTVFVTGEPGIGKTRLIRQAGRMATAAGMTVLTGRSTASAMAMPFRPLLEAFNARLRTAPVPAAPELEPFLPALSQLFPAWGGSGEAALVVVAEGLLRLLDALAREAPIVLVLEDLHDGDAETLAVLSYLTANLAGLPVLLLVSMRTGPWPVLDIALRARRDHEAGLLELPALTEAEVESLAAQCLGTDTASLPPSLVQRLRRDSGGVPFIVEELVAGLNSGEPVPGPVVHMVAGRARRLGPGRQRLLEAAAVIGARFPVRVLAEVSGQSAGAVQEMLQDAVAACLIRPDPVDPGWMGFRHALTAEALLQQVSTMDRVRLSGAAAAALERSYPGLPGELCHVAAQLRLAAGDTVVAAGLLTMAGSRALAKGAAASAAACLEQSFTLCLERSQAMALEALESLLAALEETGEYERAEALVARAVASPETTVAQTVALRSRLGWMAYHAGREDAAARCVAAVRMLLGPDATTEQLAEVDVVHAHVLSLDIGRAEEAEAVASRAVEAAQRVPLPEVVCRARQLLALLARRHGFDAADRHLLHVVRIAEEHRLPLWRMRAEIRLAANRMIQTGESEQLRQAGRTAWSMGAVLTGYEADITLAMHDVFFGRYAEAVRTATQVETAMVRFGMLGELCYALTVRAAAHAHRGQRAAMEAALADFDRWGGTGSYQMPIVHGLCRAFCALMEEDRPGARVELAAARAFDDERGTIYYQYGRYGLALLLDAVDGVTDRDDDAAQPAARLRWNKQFVHFAEAVSLGASGEPEAAMDAFGRACAAAAPFPTAHRIGLRLTAESALAHGWGEPVAWLREAEEHFRHIGAAIAAAACRTLIRRAGQRAPQRRAGHDRVPDTLRRLGVTVREYEVLLLLAERCGNREIARRLYVSHRTVEKHVASLMRKTGQPHRVGLSDYALSL